jgi:hypothetical protein
MACDSCCSWRQRWVIGATFCANLLVRALPPFCSYISSFCSRGQLPARCCINLACILKVVLTLLPTGAAAQLPAALQPASATLSAHSALEEMISSLTRGADENRWTLCS